MDTDEGSLSSDDEDSSFGDDTDSNFGSVSGRSDASQAMDLPIIPGSVMQESEFRQEVTQSIERAFAEGHSVDNAAVELKTLRMASNVPLSRVREAVIAAIVEKIPIVEDGGALQRKEIGTVIDRWGSLIDKIGGVDAVETVTLLQVRLEISSLVSLKFLCASRLIARHPHAWPFLVKFSHHYIKGTLLRKMIYVHGMHYHLQKEKDVSPVCRLTISKSVG